MPKATDADTPRWRRSSAIISAVTFLAGGLVPLERAILTSWISDDVAWQVAFRTWRPGQSTLYLPPNMYVLRWPLLIGVDRVLPPTPTVLYLLAFFLNGCGLLLVLWSTRQVLRWDRPDTPLTLRSDVIAASLTISTLVAPRLVRFANGGISTRNLETGLYLALIVIACGWVTGHRRTPGLAGWCGVAVAVGVLGLNDPLAIYSVVVPTCLVAAGAAFARRDRGLATIAVAGVAGMALWRVGMAIVSLTGIVQSPAATAPIFDQWGRRLGNVVTVVLGCVGLSSYGSRGAGDYALAFVVGVGTIGLVGLGVAAARRDRVPEPAVAALAWLAWVVVLYAMSASSVTPDTNRYVAVAISGLVPIAAWSASRLGRGRLVALALGVVAVANPFVVAIGIRTEPRVPGSYDLANVLAATVTSPDADVYANYRDAQISTYYGDGAFMVVPVVCPDGDPVFFRWITDSTPFDLSLAHGGTAYVVPGRGCDADVFDNAFGEPDRVLGAGASEIWVYTDEIGPLVVD